MAKIDLGDIYTELQLLNDDLLVDEDAPKAPLPKDPNYFLFMQGTDTVFVKEPTRNLPKLHKDRRTYKRGETYSLAARVIAHMKGDELVVDATGNPHSLRSSSIDMINGPTTLGKEVGDRIARAVHLALLAVASGKTTMQLTGFSRGAAESILVMHELERIKEGLLKYPEKSLFDIMCDSPCPFTKAAVRELFSETKLPNQQPLREELSTRLGALEINAFLIDPVPGEGPMGFGAWFDPRFSKPLPCKRVELLLCRDERTSYFIPVVPQGVQPIVVSGHHGSAGGNLYDQQLKKPWKTTPEKKSSKGRTTTVQDLALCKLFHFWREAGIPLGEALGDNALGHEDLTGVLDVYLKAENKQAVLLKHYNAMHENDEIFRQFAEGSYAYLGRVTSNDKKHRLIHFREQQNISMAVLESSSQNHFVNTEHAMLYLNEFIGTVLSEFNLSTEQKTASEIARNLTKLLEGIVAEIQNPTPSKLNEALNEPDVRPIFFEALSMRAELISQKYLRNHLQADEKSALMEAIINSFSVLSTARERLSAEETSDAVKAKITIIDECKSKLEDSLKQTIEAHYQWLEQESKQLKEKIDVFLHPEDFNDAWSLCLANLKRNPKLVEIADELIMAQLLRLDPITISIAEKQLMTLSEKINVLEPDAKGQFDTLLKPVDVHFEAQQQGMDQYLQNIERFYEAVGSLVQGCPKLKELVGDKHLSVTEAQLYCLRAELVNTAGNLLKTTGHDLSTTPIGVSDAFYEPAKTQAIACGATSPQYAALDALYRAAEARNKALSSEAEFQHNALIYNKLIPLTDNYLNHLLKEAKKYNPTINLKFFVATLPDGVTNPQYLHIKAKYDNVYLLRQQLMDNSRLPSERVRDFSTSLSGFDKALIVHRDSAWIKYAKACLLIIASLITGIIPAIVYSAVTGNSPLFFCKSHGERFTTECGASIATARGRV